MVYNIFFFDQPQKINIINKIHFRFIPIGPPFAGSFESIKKVMLSTKEFSLVLTGFEMNDLRPILTSVSGLWDLFVKDVYETQKNQSWAQDLIRRLDAERKNASNPLYWQNDSLPYKWFPNPTDRCVEDREDKSFCGLHMYDYFTKPLMTVKKDGKVVREFKSSFPEIVEIIEKYGVRTDPEINFILNLEDKLNSRKYSADIQQEIWGSKKLIPQNRVEDLMKIIYRNKLQDLKNPEVPVTLIYGAHKQTVSSLDLDENWHPRTITNNDKIFPDDKYNSISGLQNN